MRLIIVLTLFALCVASTDGFWLLKKIKVPQIKLPSVKLPTLPKIPDGLNIEEAKNALQKGGDAVCPHCYLCSYRYLCKTYCAIDNRGLCDQCKHVHYCHDTCGTDKCKNKAT